MRLPDVEQIANFFNKLGFELAALIGPSGAAREGKNGRTFRQLTLPLQ